MYCSISSLAYSSDQDLRNIHVYIIFNTRTKMWTVLWLSVFMHSFEYIDIKKPCLYMNCIKQPICHFLKQIRRLHQYRCIICIYIYTHAQAYIQRKAFHMFNIVLKLRWEQVLNLAVNDFLNVSHEYNKNVIVGLNGKLCKHKVYEQWAYFVPPLDYSLSKTKPL